MSDVIEQRRDQERDFGTDGEEGIAGAWRNLMRSLGQFLRHLFGPATGWQQGAQDGLSGVEQRVVEEGRRAAAATERYVREKPWHALGIAAGVAFILGALSRHR
jgi:hypothetical protein